MGQKCCSEPRGQRLQDHYSATISPSNTNNQGHQSGKIQTRPPTTFQAPSQKKLPKPELSFAAAATQRKLGEYIPIQMPNQRGSMGEPIELGQEGTFYVGQIKDGIPVGLGKLYLPNGSYFSGTFRDGVPEGEGRFITKEGIYYEGGVSMGQAHGKGKIVNHLKGYSYEGQWQSDIPEGNGQQIYTGVSQYQGCFRQGVKEGKGSYKRLGQYQYSGMFGEGQFHGVGKIELQNKDSYQGEWYFGVFQGYGTYNWADNSSYSGFFRQGLKEGQGKYIAKDGQIFQGRWQKGKRNGKGKLTKGHNVIQGFWENDKFVKKL